MPAFFELFQSILKELTSWAMYVSHNIVAHIALPFFSGKTTMHSLCVVAVESHVTVKYTVLHNNAFMVNLCHLQRYKLCILLFAKNYIPTNFYSFHNYICMLHSNKRMFVCSWPSLDIQYG